MIHPDSEITLINPTMGLGVRATATIPLGTVVWARDPFDLVLEPAVLSTWPDKTRAYAERYGYRDHDGRTILCWDGGRYVNHACRPAMRGVGPDMMIAIRTIEAGDEITCDYAECNLSEPLRCECAAAECRTEIALGDLERYSESWDVEVTRALAHAARVPQPLLPFMVARAEAEAVFRGDARAPSLRVVSYRQSAG